MLGAVSDVKGSDSKLEKKKVQTPTKRMNQLNRFSTEWLREHILNAGTDESNTLKAYRKNTFDRLTENIKNKSEKMMEVYNETNDRGERRCGYFDPTTTHGGPQPFTPELNDAKQNARKLYLNKKKEQDNRHQRHALEKQLGIPIHSIADQDVHERKLLAKLNDFSHIHRQLLELEQWFQSHLDNGNWLEYIADKDREDYKLELLSSKNHTVHRREARANKKKGPRYDEANPLKGWKQITTGYRKWAIRYIAYCRAEYVERRFSKWAFEKLWKKGELIYSSIQNRAE